MRVTLREVNGAPGLVFTDPAGVRTVVFAFTVHDGLITEIGAILNPEKLTHIPPDPA